MKLARRLATACILCATLVGGAALLMFPHTSASAIRLKTRIIGANLVYRPLAYDEDRWEVILRGVRSGDPAWLGVAADLRVALDTHPGEEMLGAVSVAIEANPAGAIQILLPQYGPDVVCGQDEDGQPIGAGQAERRIRLLEKAGVMNSGACLATMRKVVKNESAG
jgi:hypothetical protein